jgi:hypothetical protein
MPKSWAPIPQAPTAGRRVVLPPDIQCGTPMTHFRTKSVPAPPSKNEPDAHGQAALLLAESLIHMLVDPRILSLNQAIEVIQIAAEVKTEVAAAAGESKARMNESLALLANMSNSFESDRIWRLPILS